MGSRKHGLYGKDNAEATKCDIIQEALLDYGGQKENDYKVLPRLGRALGAGPFFLGENMSFVDVTFFKIIDDRSAAKADFFWCSARVGQKTLLVDVKKREIGHLPQV